MPTKKQLSERWASEMRFGHYNSEDGYNVKGSNCQNKNINISKPQLMAKEIPILFSTDMVKAILEGRKTQTRRIIKSRTLGGFKIGTADQRLDDIPWFYGNREVIAIDEHESHVKNIFCPYGEIGDLLWVRETWAPVLRLNSATYEKVGSQFNYRADYKTIIKGHDRFKPSIFMPKEAARIWLEVKDIGIERLRDITEEDAIAEGIDERFFKGSARVAKDYVSGHWICNVHANYCSLSYHSLWEKLNGKESLESNPWVWVIEFAVLSTTGKPQLLAENYGNKQSKIM